MATDPFNHFLPIGSQDGVWFNDRDSQYLIQWRLEEVEEPRHAENGHEHRHEENRHEHRKAYKARVRFFQEIFDATLTAERPVVPFSLQDGINPSPELQGSLILRQQPFGPPPVLLVRNLRFTGFHKDEVMLYPPAPHRPERSDGCGT